MTLSTRSLAALLLAVVAFAPAAVAAQRDAARGGTVTGLVTIDGKPAAGVGVVLAKEAFGDRPPLAGRTKSDREGRFRFESVTAGKYVVVASAPAYAVEGRASSGGAVVVVGESETADAGTIALVRGGVITGRVSNADGAAIPGEPVQVFRVTEPGQLQAVGGYETDQSMCQTDDRGIYRVYGLAPGRYVVAAGTPNDGSSIRMGSARKQYDQVFYPAAENAAAARPIDLASGGEATGVDIVLVAATSRFTVSGRVVDAETGAAMAGARVGYGPMREDHFLGLFGFGDVTNERGEFRIDGVVTGRYGATARTPEGADYYSETVAFEVATASVTGLVVKMRRGGSIAGDVVVEGAGGPLAGGRFGIHAQFVPDPNATSAENEDVQGVGTQIQSDGTFRLSGLHPGRYRIDLSVWETRDRPMLVRVEREGAPLEAPIEVAAGDAVTGVRVVVARGTAVVLGRVVVEGNPPPNSYTEVVIKRADLPGSAVSTDVQAGGRFAVEGLPPGDYVVTATVRDYTGGAIRATYASPERRVTLATGARAEVDLRVDVRPPEGGDPR
jgi:protocatechuate 3,4-dioxygenase beta subunit